VCSNYACADCQELYACGTCGVNSCVDCREHYNCGPCQSRICLECRDSLPDTNARKITTMLRDS
jgi:hypothetical protein